jgi:glycogen synthase
MRNRKRILITGEPIFIDRHIGMLKPVSEKYDIVELRKNNKFRNLRDKFTDKIHEIIDIPIISISRSDRFIKDSRTISNQIHRISIEYDAIIHIFCSFSPTYFHNNSKHNFLLLDFTMNQAIEQWPAWANFKCQGDKKRFLKLEQEAYARASHIFTMSARTKADLEERYEIPKQMITAVGSGVLTDQVHISQNDSKIYFLHDGSDYYRKGTDRSIKIVEAVRNLGFDAVLNIVANTAVETTSVNNLGFIHDHNRLRNLMAASHFVLAPARCDPFPTFVLESLSVGTPVLVSPESGASEVIKRISPDLIVDWENQNSVATFIRNKFQNEVDYQKLRIRCKSFIEKNFSNVVVGKNITQKIEEFLH